MDNTNKFLLDNENLKKENDELQQQIKTLKIELEKVNDHLKKYTAPKRSKVFYENHKEELIKKATEYNKTNKQSKEKIQEYNKRAYTKRKEKQQPSV